jgi:hypothetical protein
MRLGLPQPCPICGAQLVLLGQHIGVTGDVWWECRHGLAEQRDVVELAEHAGTERSSDNGADQEQRDDQPGES